MITVMTITVIPNGVLLLLVVLAFPWNPSCFAFSTIPARRREVTLSVTSQRLQCTTRTTALGGASSMNNENENENYEDKDNEDTITNSSSLSSSTDASMIGSLLAQRIQQLQDQQSKKDQATLQILHSRIQEVRASEQMNNQIFSTTPQLVQLPVMTMDALLPKQRLEGRTDDPTFCCFLRELGLGGWFVMTSLDPVLRKIRRHGVVVKIEALDTLLNNNTNKKDTTLTKSHHDSSMTSIPTAVEFELLGMSPCRILGPNTTSTTTTMSTTTTGTMKQRTGRWRRAHDPNGEESVLGWGIETFVDASPEIIRDPINERYNNVTNNATAIDAANDHDDHDESMLDCTVWNTLNVLVNVDSLLAAADNNNNNNNRNADDSTHLAEKVEQLTQLVDEWYSLASNTNTYQNSNVTAATRIRPGEPALWIEPDKLLAKVSRQLGPRPRINHRNSTYYDANQFCLWAAAMINPLPPLGVSMEIRGKILEAPTVQRRLQVLEFGLRRSIDNLKGIKPLL
jgi:hypothetical protein